MNNTTSMEPFVDPATAAHFLAVTRPRLLAMARSGQIPGHPLGTGRRRQWRFRLSELSQAVEALTRPLTSVSLPSAVSGVRPRKG
jgi:excisionase family DNA binding protein